MNPTNEKLKRYGVVTLFSIILVFCAFCWYNLDKQKEKVVDFEQRVAELETKLEENEKEFEELYDVVANIIVELHPDILDDNDKNNQNSSKKILKEDK